MKAENYLENSEILNYDKYYNRVKEEKEFSDYREQWEKASNFELETNFPLQIEFELHNACNFRCTFCPFSFEKEIYDFLFELVYSVYFVLKIKFVL